MNANPLLGVLLHAVGGLASASFYIPFRGDVSAKCSCLLHGILTQGFLLILIHMLFLIVC